MDGNWPELYRDYLQSQEWALKRARVMLRARHVCEGCGDKPAAEVHHLTYENVTREFLFELVALCADCHSRIHELRGEPSRPKTPTWTRAKPAPRSESADARARRELLADLAAKARRKFMEERAGQLAPEHRDVPEGA